MPPTSFPNFMFLGKNITLYSLSRASDILHEFENMAINGSPALAPWDPLPALLFTFAHLAQRKQAQLGPLSFPSLSCPLLLGGSQAGGLKRDSGQGYGWGPRAWVAPPQLFPICLGSFFTFSNCFLESTNFCNGSC